MGSERLGGLRDRSFMDHSEFADREDPYASYKVWVLRIVALAILGLTATGLYRCGVETISSSRSSDLSVYSESFALSEGRTPPARTYFLASGFGNCPDHACIGYKVTAALEVYGKGCKGRKLVARQWIHRDDWDGTSMSHALYSSKRGDVTEILDGTSRLEGLQSLLGGYVSDLDMESAKQALLAEREWYEDNCK